MGLVLREVERQGIATVYISLNKEYSQRVKAPRTLFVRFPYGHPLGEPHRVDQQRQIIMDGLKALEEFTEAGNMVELPYRWRRENSFLRRLFPF